MERAYDENKILVASRNNGTDREGQRQRFFNLSWISADFGANNRAQRVKEEKLCQELT